MGAAAIRGPLCGGGWARRQLLGQPGAWSHLCDLRKVLALCEAYTAPAEIFGHQKLHRGPQTSSLGGTLRISSGRGSSPSWDHLSELTEGPAALGALGGQGQASQHTHLPTGAHRGTYQRTSAMWDKL